MLRFRFPLAIAIVLAAVACGGEQDMAMGLAGAEPATAEEAVHGVCPNGDTTFGIDVSSWQGDINWGAVAQSGVKFAFIRVADGTYHDPKYAQNWSGARNAGILRGTYQFFRSDVDPIVQADLLLNAMGPLQPGDLPPVADVETTDGVDNGTRAARLHAWLDHIQQATGRTPIIYTGGYFWQDNVGQDFSGYPLWHAGYTGGNCPSTVANQWPGWTFWQFTSSGSVSGIAGNVDENRFNGSLAALQAFAQSNTPPRGYLDAVTCDGAAGWAQDPDAPDTAIAVHLYFDGPAGSGAHGFPVVAGNHRDDLCSAVGSCNHGFSFPIPFSYRDGNPHTVFAYGIDSAGGPNPELSDSQKSFTCGAPALPLAAGAGVLRWVTSPDAMAAWGFSFVDVALYADADLAGYAHGGDWPSSSMALVQASGEPQVYAVDADGSLRWVTSPDSMNAWHFDWGAIQVEDPAVVHAMPMGPPLPAAPFLLRGDGPAVYVLDAAPPPPPAPPPADAGEGEGEGEGAIDAGEGEGEGAIDAGEGEGEGEGEGTVDVPPAASPGAAAGCAATPVGALPLALALLVVGRRRRR